MNITDVGHLTSDADEGEDKMVIAMEREKKTSKEIADFYTEAFFKDIDKLNIDYIILNRINIHNDTFTNVLDNYINNKNNNNDN